MKLRGIVLVAGAAALASSASALGPVGTGVGIAGGSTDPNYIVSFGLNEYDVPSLVGDSIVIDPANSRWVDYSPANGDSRWIGVQNHSDQSDTVGWYTYSYFLDLGDLQGKTAKVTGRWASDNEADLLANGGLAGSIKYKLDSGDAGYVGNDLDYSYGHWTNFTISGLHSGVNTLEFKVHNAPDTSGANPTALRVDYKTTELESVPEPFTMALMVGGAGIAIRRRMKR